MGLKPVDKFSLKLVNFKQKIKSPNGYSKHICTSVHFPEWHLNFSKSLFHQKTPLTMQHSIN